MMGEILVKLSVSEEQHLLVSLTQFEIDIKCKMFHE